MNKCGLQQPARRRLLVADLNPHLMCILCGGYYVDATTIIECLHSFCKSCLVRYLESNKYCPICEVQVHKTRPLQNIRPDETLQNMVYKLVPGLFQREMQIREEFYSKHPDAPESSPEDRGVIDPVECQFYSPEEPVSLALEFKSQASTSDGSNGVYKRYLRCPAAVTIAHLQKLVRNKFGLTSHYDVDIMFLDQLLRPDLSIMDVAYAFQRKRKEQFHFTYRIVDTKCKKMKLDPPASQADTSEPMEVDPVPPAAVPQVSTASQSPPESKSKLDSIISRLGMAKQTEEAIKREKVQEEWKEVQLQISENGVMSVTDISSLDKLIDTVEKNISSVENSTNGKQLDILKGEKDQKKGVDRIKQEKSKTSVLPSTPQAKPISGSLSNTTNGKDARRPDSDNKAIAQTIDKEDTKKVETTSTVSVSAVSQPSSSTPNSWPKPVVLNSTSANSLSVKRSCISVVSSSSTSLVFSVPGILSSATTPSSMIASVSTVSVSAAKTPIASVSASSTHSGSMSSTKVTPSTISSVSTPIPIASSFNSHLVSSSATCAATVSVSSVNTPAVSARPASTPAVKSTGASSLSGSTSSSIPGSSTPVSVAATTASSPAVSSTSSPSVSSSTASVTSSKPASTALTSTLAALTTTTSTTSTAATSRPTPAAAPAVSAKKSSSSPVGYKTLKCGPKTWNPTISRNSFLSSKLEQQQQQQQPPQQQQQQQQQRESNVSGSPAPGKQSTPPRFFKMRNTPRYLGNPASGVKAMYQVPESHSQPTPPPAPASPAAPSSKAPSLMKLDPRTLTPIVSNASSPTVKSPTSQSKGRPPFPSTTLSAQVNNHIASSRSVATTTTTSSSANLSGMRSSPTSAQAQAQAQAMANFLTSPFVPKGLPNFLYGTLPSLLPAGPAQFHNMLRPYHPVPVPMLYPHQMHRQLSVPSSPQSPSPPAVQRIPASGDKSLPSPSYRSNRSSGDTVKVNGQQDSPKGSVAAKPKTSPRPATEPPFPPTPSKTNSSLLSKESGRVSGGSTNDNNNTVLASKVKAHLEKSEGEKLSHNISKLLPKAITKHGESL